MLQRTNIYLKKSTILELKSQAEAQGTTMAHMVRTILEESAKQPRIKKTWAESLLARATEAAGGSGLTDLSINHDKYLYGTERIK